MPRHAQGLIPVVQRSYDLCAGLYQHVQRFPRVERGLLGRVMVEDALRLLVGLTAANRRREKATALMEAGGHLDALRIALRLGKQLGYVSNGGYEKLSGLADEVGRMLGGWIKHEGRPAPERAVTAPPEAVRVAPERRARRGVRYTMASPTVERYLRAKLAHPEAVVLVSVGAFCQSFDRGRSFGNFPSGLNGAVGASGHGEQCEDLGL
jgi:23S rRNA-intervening sequence protein